MRVIGVLSSIAICHSMDYMVDGGWSDWITLTDQQKIWKRMFFMIEDWGWVRTKQKALGRWRHHGSRAFERLAKRFSWIVIQWTQRQTLHHRQHLHVSILFKCCAWILAWAHRFWSRLGLRTAASVEDVLTSCVPHAPPAANQKEENFPSLELLAPFRQANLWGVGNTGYERTVSLTDRTMSSGITGSWWPQSASFAALVEYVRSKRGQDTAVHGQWSKADLWKRCWSRSPSRGRWKKSSAWLTYPRQWTLAVQTLPVEHGQLSGWLSSPI